MAGEKNFIDSLYVSCNFKPFQTHFFFDFFSGQIGTFKAGHMETMAKKLIFDIKIVAKWPETGKNRIAAACHRGELNHRPLCKRVQNWTL